MSYTHGCDVARDIALTHARGVYQRELVRGNEAWSGATLQGKAKTYGAHYARSRDGLLSRLYADPRLIIREHREDHGRRVVTIKLEALLAARVAGACCEHDDCLANHALAVACKISANTVAA